MCTVKDERTVLVCDVAIGRVRRAVAAACGDGARYSVVDGQGTLVQVDAGVDAERFAAAVQTAIAEARNAPADECPRGRVGAR